MGVRMRWIRLRMRGIEMEMRVISVGIVRNAVNQDGDLGNRVGIKRIRLEMRKNWGENKGVWIEMRHTQNREG